MALIPRTVKPRTVSSLFSPTGLKEVGHTGIVQLRATSAVGWSWSETYGLLQTTDPDDMEILAFLAKMWNRVEIHDAVHPITPGSGLPPNGLGTAGVLVDGAGQTGDNILTDGWPVSTVNAVRAGDVVKFAGDDAVYMITESADSNALGEVLLKVNPQLRVSPADNAAVTTTGVTFRVFLATKSRFDESRSPNFYDGLSVTYTEALT